VVTESEFASAVKEALRNYARADLLVGSPLLQLRLLAQRDVQVPSVQDLREMLLETAGVLFANARDQKLHRVLDLTYFNPVAKQEAAAERLGLPYSSYRRYLAAGVQRMIDWLWQQEQDASRSETTTSIVQENGNSVVDLSRPSGTRRLSIVVLPFLNLSQDPALEYLVDGIVDCLMTDLSRALPGSFVISRSTAFTYRGRQVSIRQIGQELNVRYALEGSVLADPDRVRVNVQLIDSRTEEHLWAERFDKERKDMLQVQDEVVARLSRSVGIEMIRDEARHCPTSRGYPDATDLTLRGKALAVEIREKDNAVRAVALFRQALDIDPDNVEALIGIASTLIYQVLNLYQTEQREALLDEAEHLISRALTLAPDHIGVLKARAALLRARGRFADAVIANRAVIARNPGEPTAYNELGLSKLYLGATREAVEWFRRADRIAPTDPTRWTWLQGLGRALMQLGEHEEAVEALRQAVESNPGSRRGRAFLAAAEALAGNMPQARRAMAEFTRTDPGMTVSRFVADRSSVPLSAAGSAYLRENELVLDGLRRAGMPEG
jgi:adenylate cyclase